MTRPLHRLLCAALVAAALSSAAPPAFAIAPQRDPMCGRLVALLRKRMRHSERRKVEETQRRLHCVAPEGGPADLPQRKPRHRRSSGPTGTGPALGTRRGEGP